MIELALAAALMAQGTGHEGLPRCNELEGNSTHENCVLQSNDGREAMAVFTFSDGEWAQDGRMELRTSEGPLLQTFDFRTESFSYPSIADINDDGIEDIRIPLVTGNVNTEYAIFMGTADGFMHQPWQVSGFAVESANYDGLIVARARSSAAESYAEFYRFDGEQIMNEATVVLSFMNVEDPDDGPECSLVEGGEYEGAHFYCSLALNP